MKADLTPGEKAKLYEAIGYDRDIGDGELPVEYVAYKAYLKLNTLEVFVRNEMRATKISYFQPQVMLLRIDNWTCSVNMRPAVMGLG